MERQFTAPDEKILTELLGGELYQVWNKSCAKIEELYEMDRLWNRPGKNWEYEYKYRRGGKTLCTLYAAPNRIGLMIIFGAAERKKFEDRRQDFSPEIIRVYDEAQTYHDGKWMMFDWKDDTLFEDMAGLLMIKRKPNRNRG